MIFNLNFYVLMASDAFYGFPGPSRSPPQTVCGELVPARINERHELSLSPQSGTWRILTNIGTFFR